MLDRRPVSVQALSASIRKQSYLQFRHFAQLRALQGLLNFVMDGQTSVFMLTRFKYIYSRVSRVARGSHSLPVMGAMCLKSTCLRPLSVERAGKILSKVWGPVSLIPSPACIFLSKSPAQNVWSFWCDDWLTHPFLCLAFHFQKIPGSPQLGSRSWKQSFLFESQPLWYLRWSDFTEYGPSVKDAI